MISCYNGLDKSALAMFGTSESVARINQRLRRIDPDVADNNTPYKEIPLTQGKVALVDAADYESVSQFKWYACYSRKSDYWSAQRKLSRTELIQLQAFLIPDIPEGHVRDHINGDALDNRRANLRVVTPSLNSQNRRKQKNNTSGFRGVVFNKKCKTWQASIKHNYRRLHLGVFATREAAAEAYNRKAKELFGELAKESKNG